MNSSIIHVKMKPKIAHDLKLLSKKTFHFRLENLFGRPFPDAINLIQWDYRRSKALLLPHFRGLYKHRETIRRNGRHGHWNQAMAGGTWSSSEYCIQRRWCEKCRIKSWFSIPRFLSNFLIANAPPLLCTRYPRRGVISWEVYDELSAGIQKRTRLTRHWSAIFGKNSFGLVTLSKKEHTFYITLLDSLGKGEASCIALARFSGNIVANGR